MSVAVLPDFTAQAGTTATKERKKRSMEIITIQSVRVYLDEQNTAWINAEDCALGLGFVMTRNDRVTTSGDNYSAVRWNRVNEYLREFGFSQEVGKDDYIPENMFYRLAMKAKNATAEKFQAKVADEILPAIRKHGVYATGDFLSRSIADPVWAIGILTELKAKQDEAALLKVQLAEAKPKVDYCDSILQCKELVTTSQIAKDYGMSAKKFNKLLHELGIQFKQGGVWLLYQKYAARGWSSTNTNKYMGSDGVIHCKVHMYWTQKGRLGLYHLLKEKNHLPIIERAA